MDADMSLTQPQRAGHVYSSITAADSSRVQLGDQFAQTINNYSSSAAHPRFQGQYGLKTLRHVTCYVARPDLQAQLKERLHDAIQQRDDYSRILPVCGLGGAGKSQLMRNYIKEYKSDYSSVFWLDAGAKDRLENDFRQIHNLLHRANRSDIDLNTCISEVKQWCDAEGGRLLFVFDSADDIDNTDSPGYINLREYIVDAPAADIVITTRSQSANGMTKLKAVQVAEMSAEEASELFKQRSELARNMPGLQGKIDEITKELGFFALAVNLAAAHVKQTWRFRADPALYLVEYRKRRMTLLEQEPVDGYNNTVLAAWQTTYDAVYNVCPQACKLLELLAFLSPEDILCEFFETSDPKLTSSLANILCIETPSDDPKFRVSLDTALQTLESYSLVQCRDDQGTYWMHNLVHVWSYERIESAEHAGLCTAVLEFLASFAASLPIRAPGTCLTSLTSHVMACYTKVREKYQTTSRNEPELLALTSLIVLASFLAGSHVFGAAHALMSFNHQHCYRLRSYLPAFYVKHLVLFASLLSAMRTDEALAESCIRQALAAYEELDICVKHEFFQCVRMLMQFSKNMGNSEEIENLLEWAKKELKMIKTGPDETARCFFELGNAFTYAGKYIEAEKLFRHQLHETRNTHGSNHALTLSFLEGLVEALEAQQKYDEAQDMLMQAMSVMEQDPDLNNPSIMHCASRLGKVLAKQGDLKKAENLLRLAAGGFLKLYGPRDMATIGNMFSLAKILQDQGRFGESFVIVKQCVRLALEVFGKEHELTILLAMRMLELRKKVTASKDAQSPQARRSYRATAWLFSNPSPTYYRGHRDNSVNWSTQSSSQGESRAPIHLHTDDVIGPRVSLELS